MDAVILFSHGSLLCGAGEALNAACRAAARARHCAHCGSRLSELHRAAVCRNGAKVVAQGATRILVTPYFLVPGNFVKVDLPQAVNAARKPRPEVTFVVAEAIGFDVRLADALMDSAHAPFGSRTLARRPERRLPLLPRQSRMPAVRDGEMPFDHRKRRKR